jgi:hypothetical protein
MAIKLDRPESQRLRRELMEIGKAIDEYLNGKKTGEKKMGFVLMTFEFADLDRGGNYLSNAKREDAIALMRGQIEKFEQVLEQAQPEIVGT